MSNLHSSPYKDPNQGNSNIDPALYSPNGDQKKQRILNQMTPSNFTGWTPLISKTFTNEQLLNVNSTPSSKFINNILSNYSQQQPGSILPQNDIDYSNGLNLTPFLNHNLNLSLLNSNQQSATNNNITSFTPFHDKTLHLTDFFMDSPIRVTPIKDLETITPSKFKLSSERKGILQDPRSAKKTSIHDLDTPGKLRDTNEPHRLTVTTKVSDLTDEEDDDNATDKENDDDMHHDFKFNKSKMLQTPSKVTNNIKTPLRVNNNISNKANQAGPLKAVQNSSPSTVILSSGPASPVNGKNGDTAVPNSPTPAPKVSSFEPPMGVFSETSKKANKKVMGKAPVRNDLNTTRVNKKNGADSTVRFKSTNKAQMQAGMNKFQIVLSDGSGPKRGRKGRKPNQNNQDKKKFKKEVINEKSTPTESLEKPSNKLQVQHQTSHVKVNASGNTTGQENLSMNKDSSIMSGNNNSMNLSNLNITQATEHTSFDFGALSTPNGKFFLDKMFEKPSPQSQQLLNQVLMAQQHTNHSQHQQAHTSMPPPKNQHPNIASHHVTSQVMMMSTPNHQHIYSPQNEEDNEDDNDNENEEGNISLSAFSYGYGQARKETQQLPL